jgi:DNA-binding response OmpR family regulator
MEKLRLLIVDDSDVLLSGLKASLSLAGFDVNVTTQTVGLGRHVADRDVVLIDYHMPGVKGGDVARSLRAMRNAHPYELYLYTTDLEMAAQYAELGFDGVLLAKGDFRALVTQLAAISRRRRIARLLGANAETVEP